jgi:hypothetical protein
VNINKQTIKLYKELSGQIPQLVLYREVFGMTEGEAQATFNRLVKEQIMLDHRVEAFTCRKLGMMPGANAALGRRTTR